MSHFTAISGTKDIVYGQARCQQLAQISPSSALQNADSYEYFIENVHSAVLCLSAGLAGCATDSQAKQGAAMRERSGVKKGGTMAAQVSLEPRVQNGRVFVRLTVRNTGSSGVLQLEPRQLFREGSVADTLGLTCEGKPVLFQGRLEKRSSASPHEMVSVKPGDHITADTEVTLQYVFLPGQHTYSLRYQAFAVEQPKDTLVEVKSEAATFVFSINR